MSFFLAKILFDPVLLIKFPKPNEALLYCAAKYWDKRMRDCVLNQMSIV